MRRKSPVQPHIVVMFAISLVAICCSFYGSWLLKQEREVAQAKRAQEQSIFEHMLKLEDMRDQLNLDVVQVQQFISDYAATRGQDGLADGLVEAERYEASFRHDVIVAGKLAGAADEAELRRVFSEAEGAFGDFYGKGVRMAKAYAEQGTQAGNKLMRGFDEASDREQAIFANLSAMLDKRRIDCWRSVDAANQQINTLRDRLETAALLNMAFILVACLTAMGLVKHQIGQIQAIAAQMRQARDEAQSANRAKSDFLATMSHEIRTPMNGIVAMADHLLETPLNSEQIDSVNIIERSSRHLLEIINDILDYSKLEARKVDFERRPFQIRALVQSAIDLFGAAAQAKDVALDFAIAPEADLWVLGDEARVKQILFNLVSNAVKFTKKGGVRIAAVPASDAGDGIGISFVVRDSGAGISPDGLKNLFDEFWQADNSISRQYGGTGLGLAISQRLAKQMGGSIRVESRVGQGSAFTLVLPFKRPDPADVAALKTGARYDQAIGYDFSGRRILLVEDHVTNQQIARKILNKTSAAVDIANDGIEAVAAASAGDYDLILMDVHMPRMNGLEATKIIRALPGTRGTVPILALSASAFQEDRARCLEAGMDGMLSKPFRADGLRQEVGKHLRRA